MKEPFLYLDHGLARFLAISGHSIFAHKNHSKFSHTNQKLDQNHHMRVKN